METLAELGLQYVTYDRPGYGRSTRLAGRDVVDAVTDLEAVLDGLGVGRCVVIGGSGGAPHALAGAAMLPGRVVAATLVVPPAPIDLVGAEAYFAGMDAGPAGLFRLAADGNSEGLEAALVQAIPGAGPDAGDESLRQGVVGLLDDLLALHRPWGFDLHEVRVPVQLWYGLDDANAPAAHAHWLGEAMPDTAMRPQDGDHSWPATRLGDIFRAAVEDVRR